MNLDALAAHLDQLRKAYASQLPQKIATLEAACEGALAAPGKRAAALTAGHLAHKLAGSCGTFGLPELGRFARHLEHLLEPPGPADADQILPLLSALREGSKKV